MQSLNEVQPEGIGRVADQHLRAAAEVKCSARPTRRSGIGDRIVALLVGGFLREDDRATAASKNFAAA